MQRPNCGLTLATVGMSLTLLGTSFVAAQSPASPSPDYLQKAKRLFDDFDKERTLAQIRDLYEQARASGERVPLDLWAWVREDLARIGAWEYRVVRASGQGAETLEGELNALGRQRWECIGLSHQPRDKEVLLVFKRPLKSYLGRLDLRDVWRVLPDRN